MSWKKCSGYNMIHELTVILLENTLLIKLFLLTAAILTKERVLWRSLSSILKTERHLGHRPHERLKEKGKFPESFIKAIKSIPISLIEDEIRPIVDKNGSDVLVNVNLNGKE